MSGRGITGLNIPLRRNAMKKKLHPVHPGEVLLEEFLKPMDISQNKLAIHIGVHQENK